MSNRARRAGALMAQGHKAVKRGDYERARSYFEEAVRLRREAYGATHLKVADSLHQLAAALEELGDYADAEAAHTEALAIRRAATGDYSVAAAGSLNGLGRIAWYRGDYDKARDYFDEVLAMRRQALGEMHPDVASSLNNLGAVSNRLGDYAKARDYDTQALAIRRQALGEAHPDVAQSLNNLGVVSADLGDYAAARDYYTQATTIRRQALGETHPHVAASLDNLGLVSYFLGDYLAAQDYYTQALAIRHQALGETHPDVGASLNNLGLVSARLGDYAAAREFHMQALAIRRQTLGETHPDVAGSLGNLGNVSCYLGDYAAAQDYYIQALTILRRALGETHPHVAASLDDLGIVSARLGDYAAARDYYSQALAIKRQTLDETHPDVAGSLNYLGNVFENSGDYATARDHYTEALAINHHALGETHPDLSISLLGLAKTSRAERAFAASTGFLQDALRIALLPGNGICLPELYRELSRLQTAKGAPDAAIFFGKQAVNAIQRQRGRLTGLEPELQRSFLASKEETYRDLSNQLVETGRLGEAQQVLAMLKEEELFDLLRRDADHDPRLTFTQLTRLEAEWQRHGDALGQDLVRLTEEIATLRKTAERSAEQDARLDAARAQLDIAGRAFRTWLDDLRDVLVTSASHDAHSAAINVDLLERLQGDLCALGQGVALVSYILGEKKLSIILTAAPFQVSRDADVSERTVNRLVHEFRLALDQRLEKETLELGQVLWRHLIAPIEPLLDQIGSTILMVVPYGTLRYLPFAALHDGTRYLVERIAVSVLTLAAQGSLKDKPSSAWQVAGLGVSRKVPGFRRLLAVVDELQGIVRTQPGGTGVYPGVIRLDEAFTEAHLAGALEAHQAVHVASHFKLNPAQGLNSHLLLGDGTTLSLERLRDVSFDFHQVELITLSACETAMGGGRENGREFEGFAALVQKRGAKAVIASLWPVADASTPPLMTAFYRARLDGLSKAAALQAAQRSMLSSKHKHPYFWAPFILMGNWL